MLPLTRDVWHSDHTSAMLPLTRDVWHSDHTYIIRTECTATICQSYCEN